LGLITIRHFIIKKNTVVSNAKLVNYWQIDHTIHQVYISKGWGDVYY